MEPGGRGGGGEFGDWIPSFLGEEMNMNGSIGMDHDKPRLLFDVKPGPSIQNLR